MKTKRKPAESTVDNWWAEKYPFDYAKCGNCLTNHRKMGWCEVKSHKPLIEALAAIPDSRDMVLEDFLRKHYATLLALREKYDRFWPARGR